MAGIRKNVLATGVLVVSALALSACALGGKRAETSQPARASASAGNLPKGTSASVWKLRAGLNVAALSCKGRGRTSVSGDYRRLLSRHRALLAAAHNAEERRLGRAGFDRQQTRIYNRFANQRSPERFCQTASQVAKRANRMDSLALAPAARGMASELERRLR